MAAASDILNVVRRLTRDFGTPFEVNFAPTVGSQLRLPHPMVEPATVAVYNNDGGTVISSSAWSVNGHQGVLRLENADNFTAGVNIQGIYYQWFLDDDLLFFIDLMAREHLHHREFDTIEGIHGAEVEVLGIGALVLSLESLLNELATDVDVVTPEGTNIPAHQRYNQVTQVVAYWKNQYDSKAAMLGVGLNRIECFDMRRVSRTTERLVPLYRPRELDHYGPPIRVRPPIDPIVETGMDVEGDYWTEAYADEGDIGVASDGDNFFGQGGW